MSETTQVIRLLPTAAEQPGATGHLVRPRLAPGVQIHPPVAEGEPWVVQRGEHQYFRIGADLAKLARALDGSDVHTLARRLGPPWKPATVYKAVKMLDKGKLLSGGVQVKAGGRHRAVPRFKYVPPFTFQFAVVRSGDGPARRINALKAASPRALVHTVGALAVLAAFVFVGQQDHIRHVLGSPVSLRTLGTVFAGIFLTTVAHEFGHACLLAYYGGKPGRMGVMFFYMSPAMFCDVSDSWRLNHLQRAKVSLAGIFVQIGVSAAAACAAGFAGRTELGDTLMLFSLVNAAAALINLLPFVKLDGYIALMSYLNMPNLRDQALGSIREGFIALLAGRRPQLKGPYWLPLFGLGCMVAPIVMIVRGLGQWLDALMSLGTFGTFLSSCIGGMIGMVLFKSVSGLVKGFQGSRPKPLPLAAFALVLGGLIYGSTQLTLATSQVASYEVRADGTAYLYVPVGGAVREVHPGDRVEIQRAGMMLRTTLGTGEVGPGKGRTAKVPLAGLLPVEANDLRIEGKRYPLKLDGRIKPGRGSARLTADPMPLPRWTYERLVLPFAAPFL